MNMSSTDVVNRTKRCLNIYTIDSFTDTPFAGNLAAVCLLSNEKDKTDLSDATMQKIAAEMALSETAFVQPCDPDNDFTTGKAFNLRWFTPKVEVALCGHATLATAAVIFHVCDNQNETLEFSTLSGCLKASTHGKREVTLDFPINHPQPADVEKYSKLLLAVVGDLELVKEVQYQSVTKKLVVRLHDHVTRKQLESLSPDFATMRSIDVDVQGVIVTIKCDDQYDFISRYFAPWVGINEDPVTGSAHTVLSSYWCKILGKDSFHAYQCSSRGGSMKVEIQGERVLLTGNTVLMMVAQFHI